MAKMDWRRATDRDRARGREREGAAAPQSSFIAKYPGTCGTCGEPIAIGGLIASTFAGGTRVFAHKACIYGKASLAGDPAARPSRPIPNGRCHATTKKGDPCRGGAKKGELYCGPHLDQLAQPATGSPAPRTVAPDPDDEPF
jgi:hypothetical protein